MRLPARAWSIAFFRVERHGKFDSKQSEQSRELDNRVHATDECVFERIADGVSDHGRVVQRRPFLFHFDLDDFLRNCPMRRRHWP